MFTAKWILILWQLRFPIRYDILFAELSLGEYFRKSLLCFCFIILQFECDSGKQFGVTQLL